MVCGDADTSISHGTFRVQGDSVPIRHHVCHRDDIAGPWPGQHALFQTYPSCIQKYRLLLHEISLFPAGHDVCTHYPQRRQTQNNSIPKATIADMLYHLGGFGIGSGNDNHVGVLGINVAHSLHPNNNAESNKGQAIRRSEYVYG